jgi:peptidoglycan/LPS O-acetylase OafA/YrhL
LIFEIGCYLIVALLGVIGLASRRWVSPVFLLFATVGATLFPPITSSGAWTVPQLIMRTGIMFAAGALMYHWRQVIPARWSIVAVCVVIVFAAGGLLPDYRLVAGLPLAYAVIVSGALIRNKRTTLRTDLSYGVYIYAFPVQQLLATFGLIFLSPVLFFVVSTTATLPLAAMSWFLVEKRAVALKARLKRNTVSAAARPQPGCCRRNHPA